MNLNDTEIVSSILSNGGYELTENIDEADGIFLNTCSVRENAEKRITERLKHLKPYKRKKPDLLIGILGCMAERLRAKLLNESEILDLVVGPDEYRRINTLIDTAYHGEKGIAVKLSRVETYDDIAPLRKEGISAWLSIMRGCNNFCSYCVVPYTRGRERSRPIESLIKEVHNLKEEGYKEITLLGQNVNSYKCPITGKSFPDLLKETAQSAQDVRIRYTTSNPKDMSDELIETMAEHENICKHIHLPVQSGSNHILEKMKRGYTARHYLDRISKIKETMPGISLTTDIIAGFPGETEEDHKKTLELIDIVRYDGAFMFRYSPREGTRAFKLEDDVPEKEKIRRLNEIIFLQQSISKERNFKEIGKEHEILVEGPSKKNPYEWQGRTGTNKVVIFPLSETDIKIGDIVSVNIIRSTSATLFGEIA